ncbi:hemagglutinin repeat-containing protein [Wielerella bovis]|uniref:two-partner secretion domain-containing protein n=1 Tax=Wielerella bovis TaxID=2917790 RepID=UPI002018D5A5|nr:hemagglutinin repeat-containing protein [Wielerella bovis]ULJ59719.1 hemagglutinin repeat-containing protein [Wielerella bovis]
MNKTLYRVIFNRKRGAMVAVAETTKREGKSCADTDSGSVHVETNPTSSITLRSSAFSISLLGFSLCLALGTASISHAQGIVADKNAPKTQQATILQTGNGTPQINIQTPTSAGVSVNQYQQFDVNGKGAILNNSRANVQTQLGGWIQGNPWLARGEARVIVNQINSSNPSQLNGYIEVGGKRAEVVMANPAGIAVNGGGFINASRATLTTGVPQYQAGALTGFRVRSGEVAIHGQGLDTRDTDYTRILSYHTKVNAPIWGKDVRVVAGQNDVAATGDVHSPIQSNAAANTLTQGTNAPVFAIDTGALGGMYANKITLISTAQQAGIRNQGQLFATAGNVAIDANGRLINSGTIAATNAQDANNSEEHKVNIRSQTVENSGTIASQQRTQIQSQSIQNTGTVLSSGELDIHNAGSLKNETSGHIQAARLAVQTDTLDNQGNMAQTGAQKLHIQANGQLSNSGKIGLPEETPNNTGNTVSSQPNTPSSATGSGSTHVQTSANTGGTTHTANPITPVQLADGFIQTQDTLNNSGSLNANGGVDLTAKNGLSNTAELNVNQLAVSGDVLDNSNAKITAQTTDIQTKSVHNQQGELIASQQLNITTHQLDNRAGKLQSVDSAHLTVSGSLNNQNGEIAANNALNIQDKQTQTLHIDNTNGTIVANNVSLQSKSLNNQGKLAASNNLSIDLKDDFTVERNLEAGNKLNIKTSGSLNNTQTIQAESEVNIQAKQNISNRGTMNSNGLTHVQAGQELLNIGTGKIYGNHVALAADSVVNRDENEKAAVVAARERLDIGARKIENQEAAVLSSEGDLGIGGSLNAEHKATGLADSLINGSARIEAQGNGSIAVRDLKNLNNHFKTEEYLAEKSGQIRDYTVLEQNTYYQAGKDGWFDNSRGKKNQTIASFHLNNGTKIDANKWHVRDYHTETYKEKITENKPSEIIIGGNLTIIGTQWTNKDSQILVGGILDTNQLDNSKIENHETKGNGRIVSVGTQWDSITKDKIYSGRKRPRRVERNHNNFNREELFTHNFGAPISIVEANSQNISKNQQTADNLPNPTITTGNIKTLNNNSITLPTNSLYTINPNHSGWLVETDPAFANYKQWLGSDFMLNALKTDPNHMHKRLGDGYYEQKLVNEQINRLTGYRRLDGYTNDEDQFKALMQNGITAAQELGLSLGVSLSAQQVARLTSDIVWLEAQTVTLPDGSTQTVFVPKVYVVARKGDLDVSGSLMSADKINLNIANGTLKNSGAIGARQIVTINAKDIEHSGHLQADKIGLQATDSIDFNGGTAVAGSLFHAHANNINLNSTTSTSGDKRNGNTIIDRVAAVYVQGDTQGNGVLSLQANHDLNLRAAHLNNTASNGTTQLLAQNNLNVDTVRTENHESYGALSDKNHRHVHQTAEIGSEIQTQGNVVMMAGNDLNIRQGEINSTNGTVALSAKNNVAIQEGRQTLDMDVSVYSKSRGILSSTKSLDQFQLNHDEAVGSTITGKQVSISAGKDVAIRGSNVISDDGTQIEAAENVSLTAAQNHYRDDEFHQTKKSGLMSAGIGFTIGSKKNTHDQDHTSLTHTASTIGSLKGDTTIVAGKQYTQIGSTVSSPEGNNTIHAQSIDIQAAHNQLNSNSTQTYEQKGLTVALNVPIVQAAQGLVQTAQTVGKSKNDRVNAMAAANTAWQTYQLTKDNGALDKASTAVSQAINGNTQQAAQTSGISLSITYGQQKNRNESHTQSTQAQASQVLSGGKTTLIATGADKQSNINVIGSDIIGKGGTILIANNDITLQSAEQSSTERSNNKSSGWNAGIKVAYENGKPVLGVTAGGNLGKGHGNGDSITHRHSHIGDKNSQTIIQSGNNTTLKGAQVHGKGVQVHAKNLSIQSVQDSQSYHSKQQNIEAQVTVGYGASASGSYSKSKINADHQSVSEQSGIYAGNDGYQVNVKQHTQLDGGIITSTQSAEDKGKNQFSTATLAHSDIKNHSHYEGESFGIGTDGNMKSGWMGNAKDGLSASIGYGKDSDSQSSVTRSGINTQNIQITDEAKQIQLIGKTAEESKADIYTNTTSETAQQHSGSLKNTFNKDKVQSELDLQKTVSQTFSQTSQQVNSEINQKIDAINAALENKNLSAAEKADLEKQRDNWQRSNVIINMISAGLTAPTQSTAGIVAATASPALSYEIGQHFKELAKENQLTGKTEQEELTTGQKTAHILAHAVLGAAVAAAGDNNALAGAISAGGAEAAAPIISNYLYNEKDGSKLTAEQKETVSAITSLLGTATGGAIGDTTANAAQGSLNANSAVENNNTVLDQTGAGGCIGYENCKHFEQHNAASRELSKTLLADVNRLIEIGKLREAKDAISQALLKRAESDVPLQGAELHAWAALYAAHETLFPTTALEIAPAAKPLLTSIKAAARGGGKVATSVSGKSAVSPKAAESPKPSIIKVGCANPPACFVAGTLIQTVDGLKPIEQIQRGDLVWSRQEFGDAYAYKPVFETKVTENQQLYEVVVENTSGETETYLTTAEHPFYIADLGWLKASLLEAGMPLLDSNGNSGSLKVKSQTKLERWETVYNFEVEDYVTYHIGEFGVWVHNQCCEVALATLESFVETGRRGTGKLHRIDEDGLKQLIETIGYNKEVLTKAKAILEHSLSVRRAEKAKFPNGLDKGHRDRINMEQKMLDKINRMIQQSE